MNELTEKDRQLLIKKGITEAMLNAQVAQFKQGVPPIQLYKAAVIDDGIIPFSKEEAAKYAAIYQKRKQGNTILKFVPASGAATRMFKSLFAFRDDFQPDRESFVAYIGRTGNKEVKTFFDGLERFAFYPLLKAAIDKQHPDFSSLNEDIQKHIIVNTLLNEDGLGYGNMPKGLLPFTNTPRKLLPLLKNTSARQCSTLPMSKKLTCTSLLPSNIPKLSTKNSTSLNRCSKSVTTSLLM